MQGGRIIQSSEGAHLGRESIFCAGVIFAAAILATPALADGKYARASTRLEQAMTEDQVRDLIGEPTSVSLETCGSSTPHPWQCKQFQYEGSDRGRWTGQLTVRFSNDTSHWLVNSWSSRAPR